MKDVQDDADRGAARFPFSYPQKSLWYDRARLTYPGAYQLHAVIRLSAPRSRDEHERIYAEIMKRHPMLSARVDDSGDEPCWAAGGVPRLDYFPDLWKDDKEKRKAIQRHIEAALPIDGPLFSHSVWDDPPGGQLLILKWHHLVADAWSFQPLLKDFQDLLDGGESPSGNESAYREYCERNLLYPDSPAGLGDLEGWRAELAGLEPLWNLPFTRPAPGQLSGMGLERTFPLPGVERVPAGTTLYEFGLSAYALLLSRLTGRNDVCVAIPVLGRSSRAEMRTVGHFVNIVPIRLRIGDADAFRDLLSQASGRLKSAFERQAYPFALLTEKLGAPRSPSHSPMTDAYCGMIKLPKVPKGILSVEAIEQRGATWPLSLEIVQEGRGADAVMRYPVELWDEADIDRIAGLFREAFGQALADPDAPLAKILSEREAEIAAMRARSEASRAVSGPRTVKAPETETQRKLLGIWKEVLDEGEIGVEDDFFASGGHSLMAAQVMARIRASFGKRIPLGLLFRLRTVAALAEYLDSQPEDGGDDLPVVARPAPIAGANRWPLSFSQSRLWFLNRLEPESQAYNMHISLRLKGAFDPALARLAFQDLQERHESLRTTFHEHEGEPVQVIHPEPFADLEIADLGGMEPEEAEKAARRLTEENASRPFDLSRGAIRVLAMALGPGDFVLSLAMHHVIGDQWSWGVISRDLTAFFAARAAGEAAALPPLAIQYKDYADWQVRTLGSKAMAQAGRYWKEHLAGLPILELPLDRPRPRIMSNSGGVVRGRFSESEVLAITRTARERQCTPYIFLLACFAALLHRWTGMEDLPIGTPTANRDRKEFEDLIGTFVNTLALRIRVSGKEPFSVLLDRVKEEFLEAYEYRAYPFEKLVSDLNPVRDSSHLPLAQVLFNLVNAPLEMPFEEKVPVEGFPIEPGGSQFDLSASIDLDFTRQAEFFYNRDILDEGSVQAMCDAYMLIAREALAAPEATVSSYPIMPDRRRAEILDDWNATDRAYDLSKGVAALLWDSARKHGPRIAAKFEDGSYSYESLFSMAHALASALRDRGIAEGDVVGVHLNRGPRLIVSMLAVLASGAAYVPVDPAYPEARKRYMLEHSKASALITERSLDGPELGAKDAKRILVDTLPKPDGLGEPFPVSPESPAYVLYTSGSTGKPKGVEIPQRALANFLLSMSETPGISPEDRLLSVTPVSFDISGLEIYLPLLGGATLLMPPREKAVDPRELIRLIESESPTFMQATPATWRMLLESGWNGSIGTILCGGEAFPQELIEPLLERCGGLWNMYGPTETTIWSTLYRVSGRESPVPIGKPIANTRLYVLDGRMEPLPPGIVGDVYIGGTGLALGYRDSPEQTRAAFLPDPWRKGERVYRTGDRGRFRRDGNLEYSGRADGQIKLNGHRIELGEIESALCEMPGIKQAVCVLKEAAPGDARLAAYLVAERGREAPGKKELDSFLAERLPAYMIPQAYASIDSVPLTPSGKVDRKALPDIEYARREPAPPADELERTLKSIWEITLNVSGIGVEDDFFSLGGHSLLAVRLMAGIFREYGVEIPLRVFFSEPTVRGCARIVRRGQGPAPKAELVPEKAAFESDIIFPMSLRGADAPVFLIAGVFADENGMYRYLSSLVHHLGESRTIYCLRPRGLLKAAPPYSSVEEIALEYIRNMKAVSPNGPYRIIGECVGGIIAYEIARQLESAGESVEALILMDTEYPHTTRRKLALAARKAAHKLSRAVHTSLGALVYPARTMREMRAMLSRRRMRLLPKTQSELDQLRFERVQGNFARLARRYKVLPYSGDFHLLVNEENMRLYPFMGWRDPSTGRNKADTPGLSPSAIPGDHVSRLTIYGKQTSDAIVGILEGKGRGGGDQ